MTRRRVYLALGLASVLVLATAALFIGLKTFRNPYGGYSTSIACFLANGEARFLFDGRVPWTGSKDWHVNFAGLHLEQLRGYTHFHIALYSPVTFVVVGLALGIVWATARRLRRRRRGLCLECGYNLTGNVTGVCSECGIAVGDEERI